MDADLLESGALQRRQSRKSASSAGDLPQQGLEANMNRLRKIFDSLDTENTGTITVSQLAHGMEQIGFRCELFGLNSSAQQKQITHFHDARDTLALARERVFNTSILLLVLCWVLGELYVGICYKCTRVKQSSNVADPVCVNP